MAFCEAEHLADLKNSYKLKAIFKETLKTDTFLLILEILKNLCLKKKKFKRCFSQDIFKKLKKNKKLVKVLLNKKKPLEKRKKKFIKLKKNFREFIRLLIKQFFKKCLDVCE